MCVCKSNTSFSEWWFSHRCILQSWESMDLHSRSIDSSISINIRIRDSFECNWQDQYGIGSPSGAVGRWRVKMVYLFPDCQNLRFPKCLSGYSQQTSLCTVAGGLPVDRFPRACLPYRRSSHCPYTWCVQASACTCTCGRCWALFLSGLCDPRLTNCSKCI